MGLPLRFLHDASGADRARRCRRSVARPSLGYPDVLVDSEKLVALFGESVRRRLVVRSDSAQAIAFHRLRDVDHVVETKSLFAALGLQLDCIDVRAPRGVERIVDLNAPLPNDLVGSYRLVIDPGTIEHCFNIGQAMLNAARAMAVGGYIVHVNPLSMFNHGFYNLNPTFYYDFYGQNGFELLFMNGIGKVDELLRSSTWPPSGASTTCRKDFGDGGDRQASRHARHRLADPVEIPERRRLAPLPSWRALRIAVPRRR